MGEFVNMMLVTAFALITVLIFIDIRNISQAKALCLDQPITYGIQQWEKANNNKTFSCNCRFDGDADVLFFTNKGFQLNPLLNVNNG